MLPSDLICFVGSSAGPQGGRERLLGQRTGTRSGSQLGQRAPPIVRSWEEVFLPFATAKLQPPIAKSSQLNQSRAPVSSRVLTAQGASAAKAAMGFLLPALLLLATAAGVASVEQRGTITNLDDALRTTAELSLYQVRALYKPLLKVSVSLAEIVGRFCIRYRLVRIR